MPIKFNCHKCGTEIIVKYVKSGEVAVCVDCGAENVVPDTDGGMAADPSSRKKANAAMATKKHSGSYVFGRTIEIIGALGGLIGMVAFIGLIWRFCDKGEFLWKNMLLFLAIAAFGILFMALGQKFMYKKK